MALRSLLWAVLLLSLSLVVGAPQSQPMSGGGLPLEEFFDSWQQENHDPMHTGVSRCPLAPPLMPVWAYPTPLPVVHPITSHRGGVFFPATIGIYCLKGTTGRKLFPRNDGEVMSAGDVFDSTIALSDTTLAQGVIFLGEGVPWILRGINYVLGESDDPDYHMGAEGNLRAILFWEYANKSYSIAHRYRYLSQSPPNLPTLPYRTSISYIPVPEAVTIAGDLVVWDNGMGITGTPLNYGPDKNNFRQFGAITTVEEWRGFNMGRHHGVTYLPYVGTVAPPAVSPTGMVYLAPYNNHSVYALDTALCFLPPMPIDIRDSGRHLVLGKGGNNQMRLVWQFTTDPDKRILSHGEYERLHRGISQQEYEAGVIGNKFSYSYSGVTVGDNGLVYFGMKDGKIYALNANTGTLVWSFQTQATRGVGGIDTTPAYWSGRVYVAAGDGRLYCFEANTGRVLWAQPYDGQIQWRPNSSYLSHSSPAIARGVLYLRGLEHLHAFHALAGERLWETDLPYGVSSVAIATVNKKGDAMLFTGAGFPERDGFNGTIGYAPAKKPYHLGVVFDGGTKPLPEKAEAVQNELAELIEVRVKGADLTPDVSQRLLNRFPRLRPKHERPVCLTIDWLDDQRVSPSLPERWGGQTFSKKEVQTWFKETCVALAKEIQPEYFNLGHEANLYASWQPEDYKEFVNLYRKVYATIKEVSPQTKVFVSFQFEVFQGHPPQVQPLGAMEPQVTREFQQRTNRADVILSPTEVFQLSKPPKGGERVAAAIRAGRDPEVRYANLPPSALKPQRDLYKELEEHLDVFGISTAPRTMVNDHNEIPLDYFLWVKEMVTSKPLFVTMAGWPTSMNANETRDVQRWYLRLMLGRLYWCDVEAVTWDGLQDAPPPPPPNKAQGNRLRSKAALSTSERVERAWWERNGLLDSEGRPKPIVEVWREVLRYPRTRDDQMPGRR